MDTYSGSAGRAVVTDYWATENPYAIASNAITLPAGVQKATVTITLGASTGYWKNGDTVAAHSGSMFLCNSTGSTRILIATSSISKNNVNTGTMTGSNLNVSSLAGQRLYLLCTYGSSHVKFYGKASVTVKTVNTAVTAGDPIKATDRSQTGTTTTAGNVISDSHFSSGTKITASAFNSAVLGL